MSREAPRVGRDWLENLRSRLRYLYHGRSDDAVRFRFGVIVIDILIIGFFIFAPMVRETGYFLLLDFAIALLLALDLAARLLASRSLREWVRQPINWVDIVVLVSLLIPQWLLNVGFLRILRLWTLLNSEFFWRTVRRYYHSPRVEEIVRALSSLVTFLFIMTSVVYALFRGARGIDNYIDALYFTVATITTTGFGDITLPGNLGKLISIFAMLAGISLFVRLAQAIFKPYKVHFPCPQCGLSRHEPDAVHCKACGHILNIPNEE